MNSLRLFFLPLVGFLALSGEVAATPTSLPPLDVAFGNARANTRGRKLVVTTGSATRVWQLTPHGLRTVAFGAGEVVTAGDAASGADWAAPGWIDEQTPGELVALSARPEDDNGFAARHLAVTAEFFYPKQDVRLRYTIWAWPGAEGMRTQLWLKGPPPADALTAADDPTIAMTVGRAAHGLLTHEREVVVRVTGLESGRNYQLEVEVPAERHANQQAVVSSLDGESKVTLVAAPGAKGEMIASAADLASELRPDGSVTLRVRGAGGEVGPALSVVRVREGTVVVAEFTTAQAGPGAKKIAGGPPARADFLPVRGETVLAAGYYNDTQNRHRADRPLLREERIQESGRVGWANILFLEAAPGAADATSYLLVKESHKCVNQSGVDTGAFDVGPDGVEVTGWGLGRGDVRHDEWRWTWATWSVAYRGAGADARELALKRFHRTRYPVRADLDLYLKANTWGSGNTSEESVSRASEKEVLAELDSVADLKLDTLQIDDGWQGGRMTPRAPAQREWHTRPDWYPQGWTPVVRRARELGIDLGIWHAARAPLADLIRNYDLAQFKTWKLDFAQLGNYDGVFSYLAKGRGLVEHSGHTVRVNWDVTEIAPRFGYFWASECGNLWLSNRKTMRPAPVVAQPWLMLREAWQIARYLNLNKVELPIQNLALVNPAVSDGAQHSATYGTALGLPGIPVFFQTTRLLTPAQRAETKALLEVYRAHREELFSRYVFPIGDEPSNRGWSGFQWFDPAEPKRGYVLLFRERLNEEPTRTLALRFLAPGTALRVKNLRTNADFAVTLDPSSAAAFTLPEAGDVLFLKLSQD
jgi:hypothetical protein